MGAGVAGDEEGEGEGGVEGIGAGKICCGGIDVGEGGEGAGDGEEGVGYEVRGERGGVVEGVGLCVEEGEELVGGGLEDG